MATLLGRIYLGLHFGQPKRASVRAALMRINLPGPWPSTRRLGDVIALSAKNNRC
jgi:hypothetical protein